MAPFTAEILGHSSLSIVGLAKNTGKTVTLNHILSQIPATTTVAVTSIGIDGEGLDQVTQTAKPEILLRPGTLFSTSERHYRSRRLVSELLDTSGESTSLGRVVTARAITPGRALLSGPASAPGLRRWMARSRQLGAQLAIVDGALSRLSPASPAVSEALVLATGAAVSIDIDTLVRRTAHVAGLIRLEAVDRALARRLEPLESGLWSAGDDGEPRRLGDTLAAPPSPAQLSGCSHLFVAGALTDRFLAAARQNKALRDTTLVARDFTKIFAEPQTYNLYLKAGGKIKVLETSRLLAITVNPCSPSGYRIDSGRLCGALADQLGVAVHDVVRESQRKTIATQ